MNNKNRLSCARYAFYAFMFSLAFESFNLIEGYGNLSVGRLVGGVYFLALIYSRAIVLLQSARVLMLLVALLHIWFMLASLLSINVLYERFFDSTFLQNSILFFLVIGHESKDPGVIKKGFVACAYGMVLSSVFYVFDIGIDYIGGRLTIFGEDSNYTSVKSAISIVVLINFFFLSSSRTVLLKIIAAGSVLLLLYLLFDTGSRTGFFGLVSMLVAMIFIHWLKKPARRLLPAVMYTVTVGFGLMYLYNQTSVLKERVESALESSDLSGRDDIWIAFFEGAKDNYIVGLGYSGYDQLSDTLFSKYASTHNVIVEVFVIGGLGGILIFLIINALISYYSYQGLFRFGQGLAPVLFISYLICLLSLQFFTMKILWMILAFNCIYLSKFSLKSTN